MCSRALSRGFVLPTTLLVLTLLTLMLTAAFILVSAEARNTDNSFASQRALAIAQAGMETYLSRTPGIGALTTYDSTTTPIAFSNGYAVVAAGRIVDTTQGPLAIWLVRSYGYVTDPRLTGLTQARRIIAQLATFNPGVLPLRAAVVSANPIVVLGSPGGAPPIDGHDACGGAVAKELTIENGTFTGSTGGTSADYLPTNAAVLDSTHIDWASLLAGNFTPDYTAPTWPAPGYSIGNAPGNLTLPAGARQGTLVVRGDLTIATNATWDGILIIGGRLRIPDPTGVAIRGAVITGLNNLITPGSVGLDTLYRWSGAGSPTFQWNSCTAASAVASMAAMVPTRKAYIDTWSNY